MSAAFLREALLAAAQLGDVIFFAEHGPNAAVAVRRTRSLFDPTRAPYLCGYVITSGAPRDTFGAPCHGGVSFRQRAMWLDVLGFDYGHLGEHDARPTVEGVAREARSLADWLAARAHDEARSGAAGEVSP